jgi:dTDP-4-amino-4,6-dideoxygalactose transaminase
MGQGTQLESAQTSVQSSFPVSKPSITDLELTYAKQALESGWISSRGPYIEKFEEKFAKYNNMNFGVTCNSGTSALYLALKAVTYCGATPVFVDCKDDLTINPELIEDKITMNTKVILPVHIYGRKCDMKSIKTIAYEYNLFVVEDTAEGHGIRPEGDIACFSFYGNKIITTGEGGMCVTNDKRLAEQMKHLRSMAFDERHTFHHKKVGFNFRMTNIQAAIGLAQTERLDEILAQRSQIEAWYDTYINIEARMPRRDVLWMYDIKCQNQSEMQRKLATQGIETRVFFKPMGMQPMYKGDYTSTKAFHYANLGLYLPTYNDLTEADVKYISSEVNRINSLVDHYLQTK